MEPVAILASLNLASKILPAAWERITAPSSSSNAAPSEPASKTSFTQLLQRAQSAHPANPADARMAFAQQFLSQLQGLPELNTWAQADPLNDLHAFNGPKLQLTESGQLQAIRADGSTQNIHLSPDSLSIVRQLFSAAKEVAPPLFAGYGNNPMNLEIDFADPSHGPYQAATFNWSAAAFPQTSA